MRMMDGGWWMMTTDDGRDQGLGAQPPSGEAG